VWCADETPIRAGPGRLPARGTCWSPVPACSPSYLPGDRSLAAFAALVLPDLDGTVVVHDRYQNLTAFPGLSHAVLRPRRA